MTDEKNLNLQSKSAYCPLAFHGIYIERLPNGKNVVAPCCLAEKSAPVDIIDFKNNPHLVKIRKEFEQGNKPKQCKQCWRLEEHGGESRRLVYQDMYRDVVDPEGLVTLDYNTLPICNAKCVICSPKYSSTWATEAGAWEIKDTVKNTNDHLKDIDLSGIKHVYFNGGEPLLTDEHVNILKQVKDADITYSTNGSCFPKEHVLDLWRQQKRVTVFFSIDAIGENFNRIRERLDWNQVSNNISKMHLELDNVVIECSYTLGGHNVYDLEPTINWFRRMINVKKHFHVHYVSPGHELYFDNFKDQHDEFRKELEKFKDFHWYNSIISTLQ